MPASIPCARARLLLLLHAGRGSGRNAVRLDLGEVADFLAVTSPERSEGSGMGGVCGRRSALTSFGARRRTKAWVYGWSLSPLAA